MNAMLIHAAVAATQLTIMRIEAAFGDVVAALN